MTLNELIIAVKEKNLSKDQLEDYRDQMSNLYAQMQIELADCEKKEAEFMDGLPENVSVAQWKIKCKVTGFGQRAIVLKRYCLATKELLNSLKSRLYSIY